MPVARRKNYDPTRTLSLRQAFVKQLRGRFKVLKGRLYKLVVIDDAFGLKEQKPLSFNATFDPAKKDKQHTLAVDFDGRIAETKPDGTHVPLSETVPREGARAALEAFVKAGIVVIVWTARNDAPAELGAWMDKWRIPYDAINSNPLSERGSRKIVADMYLDDRGEAEPDTPWSDLVELVFKRFSIGRARVKQDYESKYSLYGKAKEAQTQLVQLLESVGLEVHSMDELPIGELEAMCRDDGSPPFAVVAPIKSANRAKEKVEADYDGDWSKLTDVVRCTVAASSLDELRSLQAKIAAKSKPAKVKDRFAQPLSSGYRDVLELHRMGNGLLVEVQYHLRPMLAARERQHMAYQVVRTIKSAMSDEGRRKMTEAEKEAARQVRKIGTDLLSKAWEECLAADPTLNAVREFAFHTSPEQLQKFQAWLRAQYQMLLVGKSDEELWEAFAEQGFRKGAGRAFDDVNRQYYTSKPDFAEGGRDQFLRSSFGRPESAEKVKLLASRSFTDLRNVTEDMATRMSRILVDGLVEGKGPRSIADEMDDVLDIGLRRADTIARTEIIRAHAEGQLHAFEKLGVTEIGVEVEWSTAGDERVCADCAAMEGKTFSVEESHNMIPLHPNCRCAFLPVVPKDLTDNRRRLALNLRKLDLDKADFVKLPRGVKGTNCGNCKYNSGGVCQYSGKDKTGVYVDLRGLHVEEYDCCARWDAAGTTRPRTQVSNVFCPTGPGLEGRVEGEALRQADA